MAFKQESADTALLSAIEQNNFWAVEAALRNGASVDAQDMQGNTGLHLVAALGDNRYDIGKRLIDGGADRAVRNADGQLWNEMKIVAVHHAQTRANQWHLESLKAYAKSYDRRVVQLHSTRVMAQRASAAMQHRSAA